MKLVTPKIFNIASTVVNLTELENMLDHIGAQEWAVPETSSAEILAETAGRLCYRSFVPGLNPNVTKVREDSGAYLKNILVQKHGSVIEHAYESFVLLDVSRTLTHELVRHRLANISQESMRYIRMTDLSAYYPAAFEMEDLTQEQRDILRQIFVRSFEQAEANVQEASDVLHIEAMKSFEKKKLLTSALRRMVPHGTTTGILFTANHRMWRHILTKRTDSSAEEEIRVAMNMVAKHLKAKHPLIYQDMTFKPGKFGIDEAHFEHYGV